MLFEWDDNKNDANAKKHGIRFENAIAIFQGPVLTGLMTGPIMAKRAKSALAKSKVILFSLLFTQTGKT